MILWVVLVVLLVGGSNDIVPSNAWNGSLSRNSLIQVM